MRARSTVAASAKKVRTSVTFRSALCGLPALSSQVRSSVPTLSTMKVKSSSSQSSANVSHVDWCLAATISGPFGSFSMPRISAMLG